MAFRTDVELFSQPIEGIRRIGRAPNGNVAVEFIVKGEQLILEMTLHEAKALAEALSEEFIRLPPPKH